MQGERAESNYWKRFWRRRLSRRGLLKGAVLTSGGLAAAALAGCGEGGEGGQGGAHTPTPQASPSSLDIMYPADARQKIIPAPPDMRGGTLRLTNADPLILGGFDPHQTIVGTTTGIHSAIFSRLYTYITNEEPIWDNIMPDLAEDAPEMIGNPPDTYIVKLRRGVKVHDHEFARKHFPGLAGRELTADDVVFSFQRQIDPNSPKRAFFVAGSKYAVIEKIEKVDDYTIRFTTRGPVAPFYNFLADPNAGFIVPREIIDKDEATLDATKGPPPLERLIGTGPWMWGELKWGTEFHAVRNPNWFGWGQPELGRPYLDGYRILGVLDPATIESLFREKKIDQGGAAQNRGWVYEFKRQMPEMVLQRFPISVTLNSRLKTQCPPFNDIRVRKALHLATDRQQIIDVIYDGEGRMVAAVAATIKTWALPQEELMKLPGYRQDKAGREQDIAEARALYEAAGRPEIPQIWVMDTPTYLPAFMPTYVETMRRNLGVELRTIPQPYPRIAEAFKRGCDQGVMSWAYETPWVDLDEWVYPFFKTGGSLNSFGVSDPELDDLLEAQRREFDPERRRELGYEIQRYLLGVKGDKPACYARLDYVEFYSTQLVWPYYKNPINFPNPFPYRHWHAVSWFDRNDPTWQGRPA